MTPEQPSDVIAEAREAVARALARDDGNEEMAFGLEHISESAANATRVYREKADVAIATYEEVRKNEEIEAALAALSGPEEQQLTPEEADAICDPEPWAVKNHLRGSGLRKLRRLARDEGGEDA